VDVLPRSPHCRPEHRLRHHGAAAAAGVGATSAVAMVPDDASMQRLKTL